MPNVIKYTTGSTPSGSLRKGNMLIGNGTADYGLTYYSGITPPSGGYTIYLNKASGGPSIYCPTNGSQLISLTNGLAGASYTTAAECLNWFAGQSDKLCVNRDLENIVTSGLVLNLDPGFTPSYPTTGTTWYDLSGNSFNETLINGPTFNSSVGGNIVFDGIDDYANQNYPTSNFPSGSQANTINIWLKIPSSNSAGMEPFGMGNNGAPSSRIGIWLPGTAQNGVGTSVGQIGVESINSAVATTNTQTTNTWLNFCAVFNGGLEDNFTLYVNGSSVSISKYQRASTGPQNINITTSASFLTFGGIPSIPSAHVYNGPIGPTQVYNRSLTSSEVLQNFNAQKSRFGL